MKLSNLGNPSPRNTATGHFTFLLLLLTFTLISGCATGQVKSTGGTAVDLLPRPGATVELGKITCDVARQLDFNPSDLLRETLVTALKEEHLLWPGDNTPRFNFSARIVDYEPGNAFKRWVLPGWGSTVLEVRGELQESESGNVAAVVENKRSVIAGGAYTIGAWKSIFNSVATELVQEMKTRINGGGFVVTLVPYSDLSTGAGQARNPLEIDIKGIRDLRTDKLRLGERTAAFNVKMDDIYANRRVGDYMVETLSDALRSVGFKVGSSSSGVTVQGELQKFRVETPASMLYWDITAEIEIKLLVNGPSQEPATIRVYTSEQKERTYVWPSAGLIEKVVSASVADIMNQIQSDEIWNKFAPGAKPGK